MSYLETKRNALLNSVASSGGGIEYISTTTLTEQVAKINIDVDTSKYGTFFIVGKFVFNNASGNWLYYGVNGTQSKYAPSAVNSPYEIPSASVGLFPIIVTKTTDDYTAFNVGANVATNQKITTLFENVTKLTFDSYSSSRYDVGTELHLYGMKESLTDLGE